MQIIAVCLRPGLLDNKLLDWEIDARFTQLIVQGTGPDPQISSALMLEAARVVDKH